MPGHGDDGLTGVQEEASAFTEIDDVHLPSLAKGLAFFGISGSRRKNQKITSSNGENALPSQSENYDVFDIDEMLVIF